MFIFFFLYHILSWAAYTNLFFSFVLYFLLAATLKLEWHNVHCYHHDECKFWNKENISMALCKTAVSPLLKPWRYCSLALNHWFILFFMYIGFMYHVWVTSYKYYHLLTLNVQRLSYPGLTRSISWLLMPWLLVLSGHQHPWYWLCKIARFLPPMRKDFNYLCHISMEEW